MIYEPETHAFGGPDGMEVAHRHFHTDSHHTLTYLRAVHDRERDDQRRELALLLATALMRGAGLDWYEQGDVWATVADHRTPAVVPTAALRASARRLISVDSSPGSRLISGQLAHAATWFADHTAAGEGLAALALDGRLRRADCARSPATCCCSTSTGSASARTSRPCSPPLPPTPSSPRRTGDHHRPAR